MCQQAIEFMAWLGMTYAGAFVALTVIELIAKKRKRTLTRGCKCSGCEK